MRTVLVAGATGYLGRHLVAEFAARGWRVRALVRDAARAGEIGLEATELFEAEATRPESLAGIMEGIDLVISSLGITRQKDGVSYRDVDYQANVTLLDLALAANVDRFAYVHVLNAEAMRDVPLVRAKQDFVDRLRATTVASTVICPSGFFSDMGDFLDMARTGRVYLFGDGTRRLNPIDGTDLAAAAADAVEAGDGELQVGGPDVLTHAEIAELAFAALGKPPKITRLPDWSGRVLLGLLVAFTRASFHGPIQFFLTAMRMDMVGDRRGTHHLAEHFRHLAARA